MRIFKSRRTWVFVPAILGAFVLAPLASTKLAAQTPASANPYTKVLPWSQPLPVGKKAITQDTYDEWRTMQGATLSADGKWAAYTLSPVVGDGEVVVRGTSGTTEYRATRGYTGRPQLMPSADSAALFTAAAAQFNADGRFIAYLQYAPRTEFDRTRGRRGVPQPTSTLGVMDLADGKVTRVPRVRSFRMSRNGGRFLAYLLEDTTTQRPGQPGTSPAAPATTPRRETGTTLVLRELATGTETRIEGVTNYSLDEGEHWLGYTVATRDGAGDGVFVRALPTGGVTALISGRGTYRSFAFDKKGEQAVFVADVSDTVSRGRFSLYHASLVAAKGKIMAARRIVAATDAPAGLLIADRGRVDFTRDGNAVLFSFGLIPMDSIPADSLVDKAVYDLWHWQDLKIMPQQKIEAARDRNRTQLAVYQLATNKWTKLGTDSLLQVTVSDDGRRALALNSVEYAVAQMWGEGGNDAYLVDATTGSRTLVAKKLRFGAQLSPGGGYVTFFDDGQWFAYSATTAKKLSLTGAIKGVKFQDEEFDSPDVPPPYGVAGWTSGEKRVLVYDRYDVWEIDPTGVVAPRNMTDGEGRKLATTFRMLDLDAEDRFVDPAQPVLLRAVEDATKNSGFWRDRVGVDAKPERVLMGARNYGALQKARHAEQYLMTQQTYREFPNLWTGGSLTQVVQISDANPQDAQYPRGTVELVSWLNTDGIPLRGLLYKPEGFDAAKQYPMVTYFYEKLSDGLYNYTAPTGRNVVNPLVYNSLGYLVFMPDIVYTDGQPGPSAAKSIIPGVQSLIAKGFVDPKRLGITGQSWGGYQTAYLATVTNMFAAAVPNATVVNMTSAYGGIRWQTGIARSFQYEHTQSRIGGSLWEYPERFVENSPLFHLDRVTTPLLFMANDNDGSVPWYQGIELYVAMRRLQKEAYMVVYNGDEHNPTKRANQKDIDRKMQDFFATKLLGAQPASWMVQGIPFLEKGRDQVKMMAAPVTPATPTPRGAATPGRPNGER